MTLIAFAINRNYLKTTTFFCNYIYLNADKKSIMQPGYTKTSLHFFISIPIFSNVNLTFSFHALINTLNVMVYPNQNLSLRHIGKL